MVMGFPVKREALLIVNGEINSSRVIDHFGNGGNSNVLHQGTARQSPSCLIFVYLQPQPIVTPTQSHKNTLHLHPNTTQE